MFYTFYWSERKTPFKLLYIEKVPIMLHTLVFDQLIEQRVQIS